MTLKKKNIMDFIIERVISDFVSECILNPIIVIWCAIMNIKKYFLECYFFWKII